MAKYEVIIDDATALRWCFDNQQFKEATEINPHQVSSYLEGMVALYGNGPKIRDKRDDAAMAICRALRPCN